MTHASTASSIAPEPLVRATIDIPRRVLLPGRNVIALHAMNQSLSSTDFSVIPEVWVAETLNEKKWESLRETARSRSETPPEVLEYLEVRRLQDRGQLDEAGRRLAALRERSSDRSELPLLRLAEIRVAQGRPEEAEALLRGALGEEARVSSTRRVWAAWLTTCLTHLGREPARCLEDFPEGTSDASDTGTLAAEYRSLLETLRDKRPIRIRCASDPYVDSAGNTWRGDAFGRSGRLQDPIFIEIRETDDDELYRSQKEFRPSRLENGYSIPLPPGRYEVRLHLAPLTYWDLTARFDVQCEDDIALERVSPGDKGDGTASVERFEVRITDGLLDLRFLPVAGVPKLAAMEIEKVD